MKIKSVKLENIRSYIKEEIFFPDGSILLAGDIGSGKTSILMAIEFGLFGLQPGQRGSSILRSEASFGSVILQIEVDEKNITIERTLKRQKTVTQDYAAITIDGEKEELSVTELKSKILNILNYPQELSKKQNLLYRFTVYTPQEEMKQIILEDSKSRINTIRYVFGIDKYKRVLENILIVRLKIREEKRLLEGATKTLDADKELLNKKTESLQEKKSNIKLLEKELEEKTSQTLIAEEKKQLIMKKLEGRAKIKEKIAHAEGILSSKKLILKNNISQLKQIQLEIKKYDNINLTQFDLDQLENKLSLKKKQKEKLQKIILEINSSINTLSNKIKECQSLEQRMQNLQTCPTCYQNVDAVYRANILNKNHNEKSRATKKIEEFNMELDSVNKKILQINEEISSTDKEITNFKLLKMKLESVNEKREKIKLLNLQNEQIDTEIIQIVKNIKSLNDDLKKFSDYEKLLKEASELLLLAQRQERISHIKLAELKKDIEVSEKNIKELEKRVLAMQDLKDRHLHYSDLENWITKKFIPLISAIERNVMISLRQEFSKLFSKWFSILVPEDFSARLNEDFSPIIEQKGFEMDYAYLSGGERTAVALAYRLALTQTINSLMSKIKTKDIIILDEPTDGFSSQQLDKIREVLSDLSVGQLIIVSHEQKIEGFVDNVIKFRKSYGISTKS